MGDRPPRADESRGRGTDLPAPTADAVFADTDLYSAAASRELDRTSIETHRIPGLLLMEHASIGIAIAALELVPVRTTRAPASIRIEITCGPGNNGGDGVAAARHLWNLGIDVTVLELVPADGRRAGSDAAVQLEIARAIGVPIVDASTELPPTASPPDLQIDAIFGTGLSRPPEGIHRTAIERLNATSAPTLAVDIPSGLDADRGTPLGCAVRAAATVTLGIPKRGFAREGAEAFTGALTCVPIGASRKLLPAGLPAFPPVPHPLRRDPSMRTGPGPESPTGK